LLDLANDPVILSVVSEYFGFTPTINSVNLHWSFPHDRPDGQMFSTESMHRDYNDYCDIALFIYLNDVDRGAGPHRYYRKTHTLDAAVDRLQERLPADIAPIVGRDLFRSVLDGHGRMGMVEDLFADDVVDITGAAGTAFLTDTFGFHRALPPRTAPRLFAWFRYGMQLQLPAPEKFRITGDPAMEKYDPYINRLVPGLRSAVIEPRPARVHLLVNGFANSQYNICEFDGEIYGVHQVEGGFDIDKITDGRTARPVFTGSSESEVIAQITAYLGQTQGREISEAVDNLA
jgi:hypothetical protein